MPRKKKSSQLFSQYFEEWVELYKVGAVHDVTLEKYYMTQQRIRELVPDLKISELDRTTYQKLLSKERNRKKRNQNS